MEAVGKATKDVEGGCWNSPVLNTWLGAEAYKELKT